jgi:hypothetical protein
MTAGPLKANCYVTNTIPSVWWNQASAGLRADS